MACVFRAYIFGMIRALIFAVGLWPAMALAHPHIFIETGLRVIVDAQGQATAVEVTWVYDPLYSLLVLEDKELDDDYDGVLRADELAELDGFDMQWVEGFEGDLYLTQGGARVPLGPPEGIGTAFSDGKITTRHRRTLNAPAHGLELRAYDPGYYSAYELSAGVEVTGRCSAFIDPADIDAATSALEELLFAMPQGQADQEFPEVGQQFADTVTLVCE